MNEPFTLTPKEFQTVNSPTFNTIATILETDFHLPRDALRPNVALDQLGLQPLEQLELVFAVEDAFRLRIPGAMLDPRRGCITLQQLCEVVEGTHAPVSQRPLAGH
ncbi:phosphopantetheine-binding protein [Variovorax sp. J22R24]|uniref:phosphopantetheine-binding protein n=1 Tax=Variovorax gracilis TaxID=3053502 RepID=UPI002578B64F|nr:phosphopantetheine-binding protein [Variovorax sp. J22R24]MDM0107463.1 phosphopantetheine-binding protein [Variovorax sp. J22R24]